MDVVLFDTDGGALELIALPGARGVPIPVASSSPMWFVDQVLSELGVAEAVSARATVEEVPQPILGLG